MDPSGFPLPDGARLSRVDAGAGATLQVVELGPAGGPMVLLLHGFPESWYSWRHQLPVLAAAGFRVVAPNHRGYPGSDRPRAVSEYGLPRLVADVAGLVRALGEKGAHVVGHDWGAPVAWEVARQHPSLVKTLAILDGPPIRAYIRSLPSHPGQIARSWYVAFFQLPFLPERLLLANGAKVVAQGMSSGGGPVKVNSREDCARYAKAFLEPGVATAGLNFYRANTRIARQLLREEPPRSTAPALVLWGGADVALMPYMATEEFLKDEVAGPLEIVHLPGVGHLVQQQAPEEVNAALLRHFRRG